MARSSAGSRLRFRAGGRAGHARHIHGAGRQRRVYAAGHAPWAEVGCGL